MSYQTLTAKLDKALYENLDLFAKDNFNGNKSEALRTILIRFFSTTKDPHYDAMMAIYYSVMPKIYEDLAHAAQVVEKELTKAIEKNI